MNYYLIEPFLTQFFILEALIGDFVEEKTLKKIYRELAEVFCLDEENVKDFYLESRSEQLKGLKNIESYERLIRTIEFAKKSGQDIRLSECDKTLLAQKREALSIKKQLFKGMGELTPKTVETELVFLSEHGSVQAMATLSFLEYHGISIYKDAPNAVKRIRHGARWNDLFNCLMGIKYDKENKDLYLDILYTVSRSAGAKNVFEHVLAKTGEGMMPKKNRRARIIEKACLLGTVNAGVYDREFAKVVFSPLLSDEDKEKILLKKQKDVAAQLNDIPFDVKTEQKISFEPKLFDSVPVRREGEIKKILQSLSVLSNCSERAYAPLMIVSQEEYVRDMYYYAIKKGLKDTPVIELDAGALSQRDFSGTGENLVLRGLSETKTARTVFMIKDCEELDKGMLDDLSNLLDYEYRKRFKLFNPAVSMDISGAVFILFASEKNQVLEKLSEECDVLRTRRMDEKEKIQAVRSIINVRSKVFGLDGKVFEEGVDGVLATLDAKSFRQIVDSALRNAVYEGDRIITVECVRGLMSENNLTVHKRGKGLGFIEGVS